MQIPKSMVLLCGLLPGALTSAGHELEPALLSIGIDASCRLQAQVRTDEQPACWSLECRGRTPKPLGCDLTAMHQIVSIDAAPDRSRLAVMSVGEGHPLLEIVPLVAFLERADYTATCTINPYPGTLSLGGWDTSGLLVESDVDLRVDSIEARIAQMVDRNYHWRLVAGDCRPQPDPAPDTGVPRPSE